MAARSRLLRFSSASRLFRVGILLLSALIGAAAGRPVDLTRWSRRLLAVLRVRQTANGLRARPGTLVVANHVSWLDVFLIAAGIRGGRAPRFVCKDDVRRWPLIGWLLERHGTVFVRRSGGRDLKRTGDSIADHLARGEIVVAFPEGTTSDGGAVLPFRPALFDAAARGGHAVLPLALAYEGADGGRSTEVPYVAERTFWQSLCAVAARPGLRARLEACDFIDTAGLTRGQVARRARGEIQVRIGAGSGARRRSSGTWTSAMLSHTATLK